VIGSIRGDSIDDEVAIGDELLEVAEGCAVRGMDLFVGRQGIEGEEVSCSVSSPSATGSPDHSSTRNARVNGWI